MVRARKLFGLKFLRQHALTYDYYGKTKFFIADFYCAEQKFVIELDGKIHERQKDYDEQRDYIMQSLGYRVLRIKNEELNDKSSTIKKISQFIIK
jgi:leucyl-tRNA synthetase